MNFVWVLVAGVAHALSIAWPFAAVLQPGQASAWLQILAMVLLVWQLERCPRWQDAAFKAWWFALTSLSATFWWLYISMYVYGGLPAFLAALAVLALAAALGTVYAAAGAVYGLLRPTNTAWKSLLFAALWTLAELARGSWFTGFPWGAGGYAHIDGWLAGYAPWVGVYGVGAIAAGVAASLVQIPRCSTLHKLVLVALLAAPWVGQRLTQDLKPEAAGLDVTLLQGNIAQDQKFQPGTGVADALQWYGTQLRSAKTALVVAPETAIPLLPKQLAPDYLESLQPQLPSSGVRPKAILLGMPQGSYDEGYTNSVMGLRPGEKAAYRYDKQHLVPFGEFIPAGFRWFTRLMNIPLGDFNRGAPVQLPFVWQGQRLAPTVCYEDLFGEELGARFVDAALAPTVFVNVSNIGWFGDSVAIDQHLNIARMRSLEFSRPSLRATNTGATVIIDDRGHVTQSLARLTRGVLVGRLPGRSVSAWELTPYAWWVSRFGLWPLGLLAAGLILVCGLGARRPVRQTGV